MPANRPPSITVTNNKKSVFRTLCKTTVKITHHALLTEGIIACGIQQHNCTITKTKHPRAVWELDAKDGAVL